MAPPASAGRMVFDRGPAGFFSLVMLMPDPWMVAGREVADAVAGSFLGRLPSDLVDALMEVGERIGYPAGSTIYREGSHPRTMLVVSGLLRVYMTSPEGRLVTVRYARTCDVLGIAVLVGGRSTPSARCGSG
ncbi:MAG: Crp/Fnr family transcriptional regulator [Pseudonocardiaceae bacterium]